MTKSEGITPTERYLTALGRRSFLSLWSHANLFRGVAKELADLTVICDRHVVLFSDKKIRYHHEKTTEVAWKRWYNKAVANSSKQLIRAKGWIENHPDRIYFDARASQQAELFLRVKEPLEVHLVAVANGASQACIREFSGGSGGLIVSPSECAISPAPFTVGNPGGSREFVHVFDEVNLNVVLQELDTIDDFLGYLRARQKTFELGNLMHAASEEDLLAMFLRDVNAEGEHDFVSETGKPFREGQFFAVQEGSYLAYTKRGEYKRKKKADKKSYLWDQLIETFAKNFVNGTLAPVPKELAEFDGSQGGAEIGLRYMALEPRIMRRAHSEAILGAFDSLRQSKGDRFFRAMLPEERGKSKTGFFVLLVNRGGPLADWSYEDYRRYRAMLARAYSENLLLRYRSLERVVGIVTEGERGGGRSEDLIYQEQQEWSEEAIASTRELCARFEIFQSEAERRYSALEYPESDLGLRGEFSPIPYNFVQNRKWDQSNHPTGNRAQRRAERAKRKRELRKRI